jgi:hypothetical protein
VSAASPTPGESPANKPELAQTSAAIKAVPARPPFADFMAGSRSWRNWSADTWALVITAAGTVLTLIVAVLLGLHGVKTAEKTVTTMTDMLRENNLLTVYTLNLETAKFFEANPGLIKFFDKMDRKPISDEALMEEFAKLSEQDQILVRLGCQKIADFMQVTFLQRSLLPAEDWDNWWRYMGDQFDESPILRDYLAKRQTWYAYLSAIQPDQRASYYRGPQRQPAK